MPEEIVMPRLSDTMEEGTISQWLKREGETVHKGEAILEVETDKATMELQAYSDGVIQKIIQGDGATVPIGAVVGLLAKPGEAAPPEAPAGGQAQQTASGEQQTASGEQPSAGDGKARAGEAAPSADGQAQAREPAASTAAQARPAGTAEASRAPETPGPSAGGAPSRAQPVAAQGAAATMTVEGADGGGRVKASPLARRLAQEHHIDLVALNGRGSGPGGRIVQQDIEQYLSLRGAGVATAPAAAPAAAPTAPARSAEASPAAQPQAAPAAVAADEVELRKPNRIQQVMARRLLESKTTIPHFYVTSEVDMAAAVELRKQLQATFGEEVKITYNDLIVRACALALRAMPDVNASWRDGQFAVHKRVNVGIAVSLPDGLVVPVIHDADRKSLREISTEARALAEKTRNGKLAPSDMEGGTFTVSNLGMFDVEEFQAIINPPESAILAVASILDKPVAVDGQVVVRPRMQLSLSVDHRVIPGVPAAQFLQRVKQLLQEPLRLGF